MKMTLKTLICALLVTSGTCFANCDAGARVNNYFAPEYPNCCYSAAYIRAFGGLNVARELKWNHTKYKTNYGYVVGAALGYQFSFVALEGEFSYRNNTMDHLKVDLLDIDVSGHLQQMCGFGNILFNIPITTCFVPYVGVGAGYRHLKPGVNVDERSDLSLQKLRDTVDEWGVYQVIGGLNYALCQMVNLQLEYRYVDGWANAKCSNHTADFGVVFHF